MSELEKYYVVFTVNGEQRDATYLASKHTEAENQARADFPEGSNFRATTYSSLLDALIRADISKLKLTDNICQDLERLGRVKERLKACADMALLFGLESQQTLHRILNCAVEYDYVITGLDFHMFSFLFTSPAGFNGGIIFHCNTKEWSIHT